MKTNLTSYLQCPPARPLRWSAVLLAIAFLLPSKSHAQGIFLTANDAAGTTSFNTAGHWSNLAAPSAANDYICGTNLLRTPGDGNNYVFAGNSLTLTYPVVTPANGSLIYKGTAGLNIYTINNLTNNNGLIRSGAGSGNVMEITGNLMAIINNATIQPDQSAFIINSPLIGVDAEIITNLNPAPETYSTVTYGGNNSAYTGEFYMGPSGIMIFSAANAVPGNPSTPNPGQFTLSAAASLRDTAGVTLNNPNGGITLLGSASISSTATTLIAEPIISTNGSSLTITGGGTIKLGTAANTYANTTISAGTLQLGVANAIPGNLTNGNVSVTGTLDLNTFNQTINGLSGAGIIDTIAGGSPILTVGANGAGGTFSGTIQNSSGTLSLTKVGTGTLNLIGSFTYSGPTLLAGGTLGLTTSNSLPGSPGNLIISNTSVLNVNALSGVALPVNNATFGSNATVNLNITGSASGLNVAGSVAYQENVTNSFNYGTVSGNPTVAGLNVSGGLSATGTNIVINIAATGLTKGQFPLIKYTGATLAGVANFSLGALPLGLSAQLVNNTGNHSIDLLITVTPNQIKWFGSFSTNWDLTTKNWSNAVTGSLTNFQQYTNSDGIAGDGAILDDTLTNDFVDPQPTNINLTGNFYVDPLTENSTLPYSISGVGSIIGNSSLIKSNTGSLTLLTSNTFTGGVLIGGGSLVITNDSALGTNTGSVTLNGGNLVIEGNTTNNSRGLSVLALATIDVATNDTARFGGTISGPGELDKIDSGTLVLAGSNNITGTLDVSQGILISLGTNTFPALPIVGDTPGENAVLQILGGNFRITFNPAQLYNSSFTIGDVASAAGDVVMTAGTLTVPKQLTVGPTAAAYGGFSQSGGSNTIGGFIACGGTSSGGVFNLTGGTVTLTGSSATIGYNVASSYGVMNLSGGFFNVGGAGDGVWPGEVGNGTLNVSGTAALTITNSGLVFGSATSTIDTGVGTANFNGGTTTLNSLVIGAGHQSSTVNFNGGTLKANVANSTFMGGLSSAFVYGGGAVINDGGFAITVSQPLLAPGGYGVASISLTSGGSGFIDTPVVVINGGSGSNLTATATVANGAITSIIVTSPGVGYSSTDGPGLSTGISFLGGGENPTWPTIGTVTMAPNTSGGLTKLGSGTLTLTGTNTFTGPITNQAGTLSLNSATAYSQPVYVNTNTLIMTTASSITGPTTVSNGAALVVDQIGSASGSLGALNLVGSATLPGATLGVGIAAGNNPVVPLINCGVLTLTGTNSINLAGLVNLGTVAVLQYASITGTGTLTNLVLPQGALGYISNNAASSTIYAVVTNTGPGLFWTGTNSVAALTNVWDLNSTTNWLFGTTPTSYHQLIIPGDAVTFTDSGSGKVLLSNTVGPASLVISNNTKAYTFSGTGTITGTESLEMIGSNTTTLNLTNNSYTGATAITNGTLVLGNPAAISPTANLTTGPGGILELGGNSLALPEILGTGTIDDNSALNDVLTVGNATNETWNGNITDHGNGGISMTKVGINTLTIGGTNHLNNGGLAVATEINNGTLIITNGGLMGAQYSSYYVAGVAASTATNIVAGGTLAVSNNLLAVGYGSATATGTLIVNSGLVVHTGSGNIDIGAVGATGTLILNGGQILNNSNVYVGDGGTSHGTLQLNGGLIQASQLLPNGAPETSVANFSGGTLQATASSTDFILCGAVIQTNGLVLDDGGNTLNIASQSLGADGSIPAGGLVKKGAGTVYLDTGNTYTGATIVSNGLLAGIGGVDGPVVVAVGGSIGAGNGGGLGTFALDSQPLTIQGAAYLRISKTGGSVMSDLINGISTANYGGTLVITNATADGTALANGDQFTLFNATAHTGNFAFIAGTPGTGLSYSFSPATGQLTVVTGPNQTPTNLTFNVSGGNLTIGWPANQIGWRLLVQSNSLSSGLLTNSVNWVTVPGSTSVNQEVIPIGKTNEVFYQLVYP